MRIFDPNPGPCPRTHYAQRLRRRRLKALAGAALALLASACGGGEPQPEEAVQREGPEEQILRVGTTWEARWAEQGFLTAPSPIALFDSRITSRVTFVRGKNAAREALLFDESYKLREGSAYSCRARADTTMSVKFGDRSGEAAIELTRRALRVVRKCDKLGFPDPELVVPETRARFVLRGDKLVSFDPPTERREYLPAD